MTSRPRQPGSGEQRGARGTGNTRRRLGPPLTPLTRPAVRPTTRRVVLDSPTGVAPDSGSSADHVALSCSGDVVYLRVMGLGNAARSVAVRDIGDSLIRRGYDRIVVDMARCRGLDSTFMGTLVALAAGILDARELAERGRAAAGGAAPLADPLSALPACVPLVLCNAPEHVVTQLRTLGLLGVDSLRLITDDVQFPECAFERLPEKPGSPERRLAVIREAHEKLIELDERNEARFGPFLRQMLAEMDRQSPAN